MNQDLINYVKQSQTQGLNREQIIAELKKAGWDDAQIQEAFAQLQSPRRSQPVQRKPNQTFIVAGVLIAVLLIGGGVSTVLYTGAWNPGWNPFGREIQVDNSAVSQEELQESEVSDEESPLATFPNSFVLSENELPEGLTLVPVDEESRSLGLESNPGFWDNPEIYSYLYEEVDITKIVHLYTSVYYEEGQELGIFLVQYKTADDLDSEIPKINNDRQAARYLRSNEVLIYIWTDGGSSSVERIAQAFEGKEILEVERIFAPPSL